MTQALSTTARTTGRLIGLLAGIIITLLGAALVIFAARLTSYVMVGPTGGSALVWLALGGTGLIIGTGGLISILLWVQTALRRNRAKH